jgi:hypothetical protein
MTDDPDPLQRLTPFKTLGEPPAKLLLHWQCESSFRVQARSLSHLRDQATIRRW